MISLNGIHSNLLFLVFVALGFSLLLAGMLSPKEKPLPEGAECEEGQIRDCMKGPCNGMQVCTNGEWGKCTVEVVCTPGARAPCVSNYCSSAYKICNDCGTEYGPCTGTNSSG